MLQCDAWHCRHRVCYFYFGIVPLSRIELLRGWVNVVVVGYIIYFGIGSMSGCLGVIQRYERVPALSCRHIFSCCIYELCNVQHREHGYTWTDRCRRECVFVSLLCMLMHGTAGTNF